MTPASTQRLCCRRRRDPISRRRRQPRSRLTKQLAEPEAAAEAAAKVAAADTSPDIGARIEAEAGRLADQLTAVPGSPAYARALRTVDGIGEREISATTAIAARFDERPSQAATEVMTAGSSLARHVRAVEKLAQGLARLRAGSRPSDRSRVVSQIGRRQDEIRSLAVALEQDRSTLMTENALLAQDERALTLQIRKLQKYGLLLTRVDELVAQRAGSTATLSRVRERRRDVVMHLAVAAQGQATLATIIERNAQVIRTLRAAETTTITALRTAGLALSGGIDRKPL